MQSTTRLLARLFCIVGKGFREKSELPITTYMRRFLFLFLIIGLSPIWCQAQMVFGGPSSGGSSSGGGSSPGKVRGTDFRLQFLSGTLDFTSISGVKRKFDGVGSELQINWYLVEKSWFRMNFLIDSRIMTWTGKDVVAEEYDDLQQFSIGPGLEFQLGPLFVQGAAQNMNFNAYNISSYSKGKHFPLTGSSVSGGLNFKFGNLGIGASATQMKMDVPAATLGLAEKSQYNELSYSLNLIYYLGIPPGKFFRGLLGKN